MIGLKMTVRGKEIDFAPWINKILLGVIAFFLMQQNAKFNEVIAKLEKVLIQQAVSVRDIMEIKAQYNYHSGKIEKLEDDLQETKSRLTKLESK